MREWQGHLSCFHALGVSSSTPTPSGPSLLCGPGKVQGPLSRVLQLVNGRDSSPTCHNPWGASLPSHTIIWQMRGGTRSLKLAFPLPPPPRATHTRIRGISTVLSIKNISMDEIEDVAFLMHCQLEPINIHLYVCMLYVHTQCHLWMYFVYGK